MRQIKFKIWDINTKKFYKPTYEAYKGKLHYLTMNLDSGCILVQGLKSCVSDNENYKLMQYTGLEDKNGKEIFEGDLLKIKYNIEKVLTNDVRFINGCYSINGYHLSEVIHKAEIIGNIYENKELSEGLK